MNHTRYRHVRPVTTYGRLSPVYQLICTLNEPLFPNRGRILNQLIKRYDRERRGIDAHEGKEKDSERIFYRGGRRKTITILNDHKHTERYQINKIIEITGTRASHDQF